MYNNTFKGLHSYRSQSMPSVSQLMDEFDTCTKDSPVVNNQKDVILCDLMMELNKRKCILF